MIVFSPLLPFHKDCCPIQGLCFIFFSKPKDWCSFHKDSHFSPRTVFIPKMDLLASRHFKIFDFTCFKQDILFLQGPPRSRVWVRVWSRWRGGFGRIPESVDQSMFKARISKRSRSH